MRFNISLLAKRIESSFLSALYIIKAPGRFSEISLNANPSGVRIFLFIFGLNSRHSCLPLIFTSYKAVSASISSCSTEPSSGLYCAYPTEILKLCVWLLAIKERGISVKASICAFASLHVQFFRMIQNSSPPLRHRIEFLGKELLIVSARMHNALSPVECPKRSLMNLKSSISSAIHTQCSLLCFFIYFVKCS